MVKQFAVLAVASALVLAASPSPLEVVLSATSLKRVVAATTPTLPMVDASSALDPWGRI